MELMLTMYLECKMASAISTVKLFHFDQNPDSKYVKLIINFMREILHLKNLVFSLCYLSSCCQYDEKTTELLHDSAFVGLLPTRHIYDAYKVTRTPIIGPDSNILIPIKLDRPESQIGKNYFRFQSTGQTQFRFLETFPNYC